MLQSTPPTINTDREQSLKPTQPNVAHPLSERLAHSPALHPPQGSGEFGTPAMEEPFISISHPEHSSPTGFATDVPSAPSQASHREKWLLDIKAWEELFQETWYLDQAEEPLNQSGQSILFRWLDRFEGAKGNVWRCCVPVGTHTWCEHKFSREDRAIIHVRNHLGLKTVPLRRRVQESTWYANKPFPREWGTNTATSTARFDSNEGLKAHRRPNSRRCEWW